MVGYAVAVTKAGNLLVLEFRDADVIAWNCYSNWEELKNAKIDNQYPRYPESLVQAVAAEVDTEYVEELDL